MYERRTTRQVLVGRPPGPSVAVGGDAPISVQSMTTTKTADVDGTLAQIYALASAGCDIVRCTCNEEAAAEGLAQIVPRSPVPIIADIHFQYRLALAAMEAGVQGLRLNPGNIRKARAHQARRQRGEGPRAADPHRRQRGQPRPRHRRAVRRRHPRSARRVGAARARVLRRGRLRGLQDLGEGEQRRHDDRRVPPALRDGRLPAAPRRHRSRAAAGRAREVHRRDRHAARRGHRRHDPLLAHRGPGRGSAPDAPCSSRSGCASARASTSSRARAAAGPRST